jgi:hypothetical protein
MHLAEVRMSDAISVLLDNILADAKLRPRFQDWCRKGYVLAEGRRVRFVLSDGKRGHFKVKLVVEPKYEQIPAKDWGDLTLHNWDGEWRLEGARKWYDTKPVYEAKEWRFVRFRPSDDLPNEVLFNKLTRSVNKRSHTTKVSILNTIKHRLTAGDKPGTTIQWKEFCDLVRDGCDGWVGLQKRRPKRGFGDKSIKRIVTKLQTESAE